MKSYTIIFMAYLVFLLSCEGIQETIPAQDDIISIELLAEDGGVLVGDIIGDGESIIKVRATIPAKTDEKFRTVKFKTSAGTFVGISTDPSVQKVNVNGIAQADLRLPLVDKEMIIYVSAEITDGSDSYMNDTLLEVKEVGQIISVELLSLDGVPITKHIPADGDMIVLVQAELLVDAMPLSQVTIEVSGGELIGVSENKISLTPDANALVSAIFRMPNAIDPIFITASVGSNPIYKDRCTINPIRSYPDSLYIEPQKLSMSLHESNLIEVFLSRNVGKVTQGLPVSFKAFQQNGSDITPVGRFTGLQNAQSDANGDLSVTFHTDTGNIDTSLNVVVLAETIINDGVDTLRKDIVIDVN